MSNETTTCSIIKITGLQAENTEDIVVLETSITLYYNQVEIATLLCSPSDIEELALGFFFSEGFIESRDDLYTLRYVQDSNIIWAEGRTLPDPTGHRFLSACCGKSRASFAFANDARLAKPQASQVRLSLEEAYTYADYLQTHLPLFQATGGIHSGGIAYQGEILFTSYDIGRHNVFDKLFGKAFQAGIDLSDHIIFFSGRVSSEILLKVAKMNIPVLIARSAPTDLALTLARDLNITVAGFARNNRLNIYTCPGRLLIPGS
ncbi:MAG: formate dehydrogenase accessory sulfurtransferase FdhD [Desulfitobacteriaceae bacterium]|nr:formate dehydrogenase accessory sulfurtransferase FdhD [Desulfitobacteriaceae bacterium]MDI6913031.1 formate dehydrogenase accessory sulfurtransferase FdhD [Desulfitobacteriaceae bacterium]